MQGRIYPTLPQCIVVLSVCVCLLFKHSTLRAQNTSPDANSQVQPVPPPAADIAHVGLLDIITPGTWLWFADTKEVRPERLPYIVFPIHGTSAYDHFMPVERVDKKAFLEFTLFNSSDSLQQVYFCPGFYCDSIQLYRLNSPGHVEALPHIMPQDKDSLGYRLIEIPAHDTLTYFASLDFIKSPTNNVFPSLTRASFITQGIQLAHHNRTNIDVITNLFAGIMLMMIFYGFSEYLQTSKPEFIYYAAYCLCISALLFLKSTLHASATHFNYVFESWLDNIIFSLGHIFYIVFHRKFLETKKSYRSLDRFLFWGVTIIAVLTFLYTVTFFFTGNFQIPNFIENATKCVLLLISLGFIIKGLTYRNQLMNYIVFGNISLFLLSVLSQIMIATNFHLVKTASVLNLALFYYEVGITIELLFFLFALTYKNKMEIIFSIQKEEKLKLETERKELEKQVAVLAAKQDERNRISADMHDELGSGVTAIRLMSEIVKSKMKEQTLPEIEKISHSANELLNKMNTIIWTMTSSNDSVENLVAYIRSYAVEFFESTAIDCYFSMPASIPFREISGEKRRNMFLSVKESLNNVLKHSQCNVVRINVLVNDKLIIEIQDDGVGINMEKLRKFGNGLSNMKKRMASIDGEFDIENREGTRTLFSLQL